MASRNILKKITIKTCKAKPNIEDLIEYGKEHGKNAVMPLLIIVGTASDYKTGDSDGRPWVKLVGMFKATNLLTGEVFQSGTCILPEAANDLVYGALRALDPSKGGSVDFAFRIGVVRDETAATGYVYSIEQIYEPQSADPVASLEQRLGLNAPAELPAPEQEPAVEKPGKKNRRS